MQVGHKERTAEVLASPTADMALACSGLIYVVIHAGRRRGGGWGYRTSRS
jgi:hypothetical protein